MSDVRVTVERLGDDGAVTDQLANVRFPETELDNVIESYSRIFADMEIHV